MSRPGVSSSRSSYHDKRRIGLIASRMLESEMSAAKKQKLAILCECPHCNKLLTRKTFKKHRQLFCKTNGTWITSSQLSESKTLREGSYKYSWLAIQIYMGGSNNQ